MVSATVEYFAPVLREWKEAARKWRLRRRSDVVESTTILYGNNYNWIPSNIRLYIENTMEKTYTWREEIGGREYTINISCGGGGGGDSGAQDEAREKICSWLDVISKYGRKASVCSPKINIYLYLTNARKILPERRGAPIEPENVNTAYTTSCVRPGSRYPAEIYLFRREEWFKVFIHETFHLLGLDFSTDSAATAERAGRAILASPATRDCEWLIFETYTEIMAEIMALGAAGALRARDIKNETMFSAAQTIKLLHHMDLKYEDLWCSGCAAAAAAKWREKTPAFCYYVLKMILWVHLPEFLEWCRKNNTNILCAGSGEKVPQSFALLLREHAESEKVAAVLRAAAAATRRRNDGDTSIKMMYLE
jgi:hypothetical protein